MYDLHAHILPGLDDGSETMEMSLAMALIATETGTDQLVATPHIIDGIWMPAWGEIVAGCSQLEQVVRQANINISILPGAEVAMYPGILKLLLGPGPYCINGGRYLLVELPAAGIPLYADEFFFTLQLRGIIPVLVHPERHLELRNDFNLLEAWIRRGVLVQLNGPSITGHLGVKVRNAAETLLKRGMVHCIGSDAHNNFYRSTDLSAERKRIWKLVGPQRGKHILLDNPDRIVSNSEMDNSTYDIAERTGIMVYD